MANQMMQMQMMMQMQSMMMMMKSAQAMSQQTALSQETPVQETPIEEITKLAEGTSNAAETSQTDMKEQNMDLGSATHKKKPTKYHKNPRIFGDFLWVLEDLTTHKLFQGLLDFCGFLWVFL